jgi:ABC-type glutathione transport system ATPase component
MALMAHDDALSFRISAGLSVIAVTLPKVIGVVHADQILVLDRGRIVERGTHRTLLGAGEYYCTGTYLNASGMLTRTNSSNNPVFEFNDATQAVLPLPYQDGIQAKHMTPAKVLIAAENIVSSCLHTACTSDGVVKTA